MKRDRYSYLCQEAEAGRDAFVIHPATQEEGLVDRCILKSDHLLVKTANGPTRCWDYHECEELSRMNREWPYR